MIFLIYFNFLIFTENKNTSHSLNPAGVIPKRLINLFRIISWL